MPCPQGDLYLRGVRASTGGRGILSFRKMGNIRFPTEHNRGYTYKQYSPGNCSRVGRQGTRLMSAFERRYDWEVPLCQREHIPVVNCEHIARGHGFTKDCQRFVCAKLSLVGLSKQNILPSDAFGINASVAGGERRQSSQRHLQA
jgi:hypothetical protein